MGELQRRLTAAGSSVRAVGAHPGYTATGITMHTGNSLFTSISRLGNLVAGMKPWRGALPVLAAATLDIPGDTYLGPRAVGGFLGRSEEHTSELQSLMRISYAVFCLKTKNRITI